MNTFESDLSLAFEARKEIKVVILKSLFKLF